MGGFDLCRPWLSFPPKRQANKSVAEPEEETAEANATNNEETEEKEEPAGASCSGANPQSISSFWVSSKTI